jgi:hypothetical protein
MTVRVLTEHIPERLARGSVAATWSPKRMLQFEFEGGGVFSDGANTFGTTEERGYFFSLGVRKDF